MAIKNSILNALKSHRQLLLYCLIGASGALLDLVVFLALYNILQIDPILATIISTSCGIVNNFFLNIKFNFKVKDNLHHRLASFYIIGFTGLALSVLVISVLHNTVGLSANLAKIISIPIVVIFQYILNKNISFKEDFHITKAFKAHRKALLFIVGTLGLYALFMWHSTYLGFQDEIDNILGGWLISHRGEIIYKDFFSHHMPLPYFVSAVITFFTDNNINAFRFVYLSGLFVWLLIIMRKIAQHFGLILAYTFGTLIALLNYTFLAHLVLAETLIAYASIHALLLIGFDFYYTKRASTYRDIIAISILGAIPVLSSVSYMGMSILIYVSFAVYYVFFEKRLKRPRLVPIIRDILTLAAPYILLGAYFLATNSLHQFIQDAYRFNINYYSQFTSDAGTNLISTLANGAGEVIRGSAQALHIAPGKVTFLATLCFIAVLLVLIALYMQKKFMLLVFFSIAIYVSACRGSITVEPVTEGTRRMMIYGFIVCFAAIYLLYYAFVSHQKNRSDFSRFFRLASGSFGIIVVLLLAIQGLNNNISITLAGQSIETGISSPKDGGHKAAIINTVNTENDTYWIGPWDFYTQMYIKGERASRFTFFLPWHNVCPQCQTDLMRSIESERPNVIYWEKGVQMIGHDVDSYNKLFLEYADNNYYQFNTSELKDFYFRKDNLDHTKKVLREQGYLR